MSMTRRSLVLLAASTTIAGCSTAPYTPALPPPEPIRLAVGRADTVLALSNDGARPVDFIAERRQQQARERVLATLRSAVQASGGTDSARLELLVADLSERVLPGSGSVTDRLGIEPATELFFELSADLVISDSKGTERARAGAQVSRTDPVQVGTTVRAKQEQAGRLIDEGGRLLIAALREAARERLAAWAA